VNAGAEALPLVRFEPRGQSESSHWLVRPRGKVSQGQY
jgi:hypothetical protein